MEGKEKKESILKRLLTLGTKRCDPPSPYHSILVLLSRYLPLGSNLVSPVPSIPNPHSPTSISWAWLGSSTRAIRLWMRSKCATATCLHSTNDPSTDCLGRDRDSSTSMIIVVAPILSVAYVNIQTDSVCSQFEVPGILGRDVGS
jgi:hypothetical protein